MAKSKYEDVKRRLAEVERWAKDGLIDQEIAKRLGISLSSYYDYQIKYLEFSETIKRGKAYADYEVEQSLFKRAMGYEYDETTQEPDNDGVLRVTKIVTKQVVPDTTAQIFWLKNRQPEKWRDKQDINMQGSIGFNKGGLDDTLDNLWKEE